MASITAGGLGIRFLFDRQGRPVTPGIARIRRRVTESWGLRGVDLKIEPGETVALTGPNGAGKTTLLRALAGVYEPDAGTLAVEGRIGSLLALHAGLLPRLTGRENAVLLGVLAGLSRAEVIADLDAIGFRARLGPAYDRPSSSYSAGMKARLGLAVIERARAGILLLDEVYEALDAEFRATLIERAEALAAEGGIVVAAGHDHAELGRLCERAIRLESGRIAADGPFTTVAGGQLSAVAS